MHTTTRDGSPISTTGPTAATGGPAPATPAPSAALPTLPTLPRSVVWCDGHSFVLEEPGPLGPPRWVGLDPRGRPAALSAGMLATLPWTLTPR